ncbi:MAG: hypothetical protein M1816_006392 [Peltula sp. TS41687]|nr:MAG: hypothetical protein M1816_006392 [Peltula sp. TS41687]
MSQMNAHMHEPSEAVPPPLLPHIHLVSNFRFPVFGPDTPYETIVEYLLQAYNITRHSAPMNWTFLDAPPDNTVLLVWQPSQLGLNFASDGYIWADPEAPFSLEVKGCVLEMLVHRSGFQLGKDYLTTHSRRRYRLSGTSNPNTHVEPSLWMVHYTASEVNHRYPANQIPITSQIQQTLNARQFLMSRGQLVRKEFMLHDKGNWPHINLPGGGGGPTAATAGLQQQVNPYARATPGAMAGRGGMPPQQQQQQQPPLYPPQQPTGRTVMASSSPSKRPRMVGLNQQIPSTMTGVVPAAAVAYAPPPISIEDEEDTAHGDSVDHVTQRELSTLRYKQHHAWMEEIFSSPYTMSQITPLDLKLAPVIERVLGVKNVVTSSAESTNTTGGLQVKIDELKKRTDERLAGMQAEMDKTRKKHARTIQRSKASMVIEEAEKELGGFDVGRPENVGEIWRIEKEAEAEENRKPTDEIIKEVEAVMGKKIVPHARVRLVQKSGLPEGVVEEKEKGQPGNVAGHISTTVGQQAAAAAVAETGIPTAHDGGGGGGGSMAMEDDVVAAMNNDAGHLLDQYGLPSSTTTPGGSVVQTPIGGGGGGGDGPALTQLAGASSSSVSAVAAAFDNNNHTLYLSTQQTQEYPQQQQHQPQQQPQMNTDVNLQPQQVPYEPSSVSLDVDMTGVDPGPILPGVNEVGGGNPSGSTTVQGPQDVFATAATAGGDRAPTTTDMQPSMFEPMA